MIIRRAAPADYQTMGQIWLEASRVGHPFLGNSVLEGQLATVRDQYFPAAENWVAEDGAVLGFIGLLGAHVGGLFVSPAVHRRGVGRRFLDHAARLHGTLTVEVYEQNETAVNFYLRCGFIPNGRKETDDEGRPFALIRMTKDNVL